MHISYRIFAILFLAAALYACGPHDDANHVKTRVEEAPVNLRVMTFNIEWGGENISFDKVVEAIRLSGAEIVGIQEAQGNLKRLADELGWHYDLRNYIISKFPLINPPGANGQYLLVEVQPGKVVAIANVHLPSEQPGPHAIRDGASPEEVLAIERSVRLPEILPTLESIAPMLESGVPLFVTGDFNAPSHLDWTEVTIGARPFVKFALNWPVSMAMTGAGLRDAWREVYPDPLTHPGLTWWAGRPPLELYAPDENDPRDRIDFIWFAGGVNVQSAELIGEVGFPGVSVSVDPWPSDHRAVLAQFSVSPAEVPAYVDADRWVYREGEHVDVRFNHPGNEGLYISLWKFGNSPELLDKRINNESGHSVFAADMFQPGRYRAVLTSSDESVHLEDDFWVLASDGLPGVTIGGDLFKAGEALNIHWKNAPGNRNDYLAVYDADTEAGYGNELSWAYIDSMPEGELVLDEQSAETGWPLAPGKYKILLMRDDGYEAMAGSEVFSVLLESTEGD